MSTQYHKQVLIRIKVNFSVLNTFFHGWIFLPQVQDDIPECVHDLLWHKVSDGDTDGCSNYASSSENGVENLTKVINASSTKTFEERGHILKPKGEDDSVSTLEDSINCDRSQLIGIAEKNVCSVEETVESNDDSDSANEEIADENVAAYQKYKSICGTVSKYLESKDSAYFETFLIPEKFFRRFWVMDIVTEKDHNCCCFTKR